MDCQLLPLIFPSKVDSIVETNTIHDPPVNVLTETLRKPKSMLLSTNRPGSSNIVTKKKLGIIASELLSVQDEREKELRQIQSTRQDEAFSFPISTELHSQAPSRSLSSEAIYLSPHMLQAPSQCQPIRVLNKAGLSKLPRQNQSPVALKVRTLEIIPQRFSQADLASQQKSNTPYRNLVHPAHCQTISMMSFFTNNTKNNRNLMTTQNMSVTAKHSSQPSLTNNLDTEEDLTTNTSKIYDRASQFKQHSIRSFNSNFVVHTPSSSPLLAPTSIHHVPKSNRNIKSPFSNCLLQTQLEFLPRSVTPTIYFSPSSISNRKQLLKKDSSTQFCHQQQSSQLKQAAPLNSQDSSFMSSSMKTEPSKKRKVIELKLSNISFGKSIKEPNGLQESFSSRIPISSQKRVSSGSRSQQILKMEYMESKLNDDKEGDVSVKAVQQSRFGSEMISKRKRKDDANIPTGAIYARETAFLNQTSKLFKYIQNKTKQIGESQLITEGTVTGAVQERDDNIQLQANNRTIKQTDCATLAPMSSDFSISETFIFNQLKQQQQMKRPQTAIKYSEMKSNRSTMTRQIKKYACKFSAVTFEYEKIRRIETIM